MSHAAADRDGEGLRRLPRRRRQDDRQRLERDISFHANTTAGVTTCNPCHGGGTPGTNNNMPAGLTDSSTMTTSSASPANTPDQTHPRRHQRRPLRVQLLSHPGGRLDGPWRAGQGMGAGQLPQELHRFEPAGDRIDGRGDRPVQQLPPEREAGHQLHGAGSFGLYSPPRPRTAARATPGRGPAPRRPTGRVPRERTPRAAPRRPRRSTATPATARWATPRCTCPSSASSHFGGITNGNSCTSCHVNFAGFKGTTTNLLYKHTNATANSGGCVRCHAFVSQAYTTLTTTPSLTRPVSAGGHTFSQTLNVTGAFDDESFTAAHTATKMTACGACHQYATTTATTNIWAFKHRPSNPGISNSKSSSGCNSCH